LNLVGIFEKAAFGGAGGARPVSIVRASVAGTHKQAGLWEPTNRAAEVSTVDREYLQFVASDAPYPTGGVGGLAICGRHIWISKSGEACLAFGEIAHFPERHPREISIRATTCQRGEEESHHWYCDYSGRQSVEQNSQLHEESAARNRFVARGDKDRLSGHRVTPAVARNSTRNTAALASVLAARRATRLRRLFLAPTSACRANWRASRAHPAPDGRE